MTYVISLLATGLFAAVFRFLDVASIAKDALLKARRAAAVLLTDEHSDREKERAARTVCIHLFRCAIQITLQTVAALAPAAVLIVGADRLGIASMSDIVATLASPAMVALTVVLWGSAFVVRR